MKIHISNIRQTYLTIIIQNQGYYIYSPPIYIYIPNENWIQLTRSRYKHIYMVYVNSSKYNKLTIVGNGQVYLIND